MKALRSVIPSLLISSSSLLFLAGCYTQVVTEDEDRGYASRSREYREEEVDSTDNNAPPYDDESDNYRSRYSIGFRYYYPAWSSNWVHYDPWYYDQWYYDRF